MATPEGAGSASPRRRPSRRARSTCQESATAHPPRESRPGRRPGRREAATPGSPSAPAARARGYGRRRGGTGRGARDDRRPAQRVDAGRLVPRGHESGLRVDDEDRAGPRRREQAPFRERDGARERLGRLHRALRGALEHERPGRDLRRQGESTSYAARIPGAPPSTARSPWPPTAIPIGRRVLLGRLPARGASHPAGTDSIRSVSFERLHLGHELEVAERLETQTERRVRIGRLELASRRRGASARTRGRSRRRRAPSPPATPPVTPALGNDARPSLRRCAAPARSPAFTIRRPSDTASSARRCCAASRAAVLLVHARLRVALERPPRRSIAAARSAARSPAGVSRTRTRRLSYLGVSVSRCAGSAVEPALVEVTDHLLAEPCVAGVENRQGGRRRAARHEATCPAASASPAGRSRPSARRSCPS